MTAVIVFVMTRDGGIALQPYLLDNISNRSINDDLEKEETSDQRSEIKVLHAYSPAAILITTKSQIV